MTARWIFVCCGLPCSRDFRFDVISSHATHIPCEIPSGWYYNAIVHFDNPLLKIEYEKWSWRRWKKRVHEVELSIAELESVTFKASFTGTYLLLRGRSLRTFQAFPTDNGAVLRLNFKRKYRKAAEHMGSSMRLALSELRLTEMGHP